MKDIYENLQIEVVAFKSEDIIICSPTVRFINPPSSGMDAAGNNP